MPMALKITTQKAPTLFVGQALCAVVLVFIHRSNQVMIDVMTERTAA